VGGTRLPDVRADLVGVLHPPPGTYLAQPVRFFLPLSTFILPYLICASALPDLTKVSQDRRST
jgi:hypothetical protein